MEKNHLLVRCNNPECSNIIETTYGKMRGNRSLFCSTYCRSQVHKHKLQKYINVCKGCNREFETYIKDRNHCSIWCEEGRPKLTDGNYRHYLFGEPLKDISNIRVYDNSEILIMPRLEDISVDDLCNYEVYIDYGYIIDGKLYEYLGYGKIIDMELFNNYYINHKKDIETCDEVDKLEYDEFNKLMINEYMAIDYNKNKSKIKKINKKLPKNKKISPIKDDLRIIYVKCNNPLCDNVFPVNLYELNTHKRLFCSDACKMKVYRMRPKPLKHIKLCKNCNRIFITYDDTREYCNETWCKQHRSLSPKKYKDYINNVLYVEYSAYSLNAFTHISYEEFIYKHEVDKLIMSDKKRICNKL